MACESECMSGVSDVSERGMCESECMRVCG